jgi:predicted nucleic acid-binding protein
MALLVKDSMVLIHLAKMSLLEKSCDFFGKVIVPQKVFEETVNAGKEKGFADAFLIEKTINNKKIAVIGIKKGELTRKANEFNIFGGEADAVALYWQERAGLLASDDDNVRSKKDALGINLIGTPAILLALYNKKAIDAEKALQSIQTLRKIGWFSSHILDKSIEEVKKE